MQVDLTDLELCKKQARKRRAFETFEGYLYAMPVILGILIFTAFPVLYALVSSFSYLNLGELNMHGFTFENYLKPFLDYNESRLFLQSLKVTFKYAVINIPLNLILSFCLALFLNQKLKGIKFFRVLYYAPVLIPAVCSGLVWRNLLSVDYGLANALLEKLHLPAYSWFSQPSTCMPSFIMVGLFGLGGGMILWLAQLKNVPISLYESARLDGGGFFTQLFKITLPMCTPMIFYNLVLSIISTLQTFTSVQVISGGSGEGQSLLFYILNIYGAMFTRKNIAYASALSFILMIIIGLLTLIVFKTGGWVYYGEDD